MSIRDLEKLNARQMETLQRKQQRETSRLQEGHQNMKAEVKKANDLELVDIKHQHVQHVAEASEKKEKVLEQMRSHLDQTRKMTDREIKDLKENASKVKQEENVKLSVSRDTMKSENDLYLDELNYRYGKEIKKVNSDNQSQLEQMKAIRGQELTDVEAFHQDKINTQTNQANEKFQHDSLTYRKIKDDTDRQFKNERATTNVRQQQDLAKLTDSHNTHLSTRDKEFRKGLKTQDVDFDKRYAKTLDLRNKELETLEEKNKLVMTKMKDEMTEVLKTNINRSDDAFYKFTELSPELTQFEDRVEIKVNIPEHSKADVQLSIHGKEAIINFNRRYDDTRQAEGMTNKLHKVESFTTRLMTKHHLDPKSVKASYENGFMTYTVKGS